MADQDEPSVEAGIDAIITCNEPAPLLSGIEGAANWAPQWLDPAGVPIPASGWSIAVSSSGIYTLEVTNNTNGCTSSDQAAAIDQTTPPTANAGGDGLLDCQSGAYQLNLSESSQGAHFEYIIRDASGTEIYAGTAPSTVLNQGGQYSLEVINISTGCTATDQFEVSSESPYELMVATEDASCVTERGSILFEEVLGGLPPYLYSVDGGTSFTAASAFSDLPPGQYDLFVQDANGCELAASTSINIPAGVQVFLPELYEIKLGDSVRLSPQVATGSAPIDSLWWSPPTGLSCVDCRQPYAKPLSTQWYELMITDENNCEAYAKTLVVVDTDPDVYIPNAFSPNTQDGVNDRFTIYARNGQVEEIEHLMIFDRWGNQLFTRSSFQPNDPSLGWDGTFDGQRLNSAVFIYMAEVRLVDGRIVHLEGEITLVQ